MLIAPLFVGWLLARYAGLPLRPTRTAAITATIWWIVGATISDWGYWFL